MTIDLFADIACPWCYIGERRLRAALSDHPEATVRWRPFQLQPSLPETGVPWRAFAEQKFGGWERALAMFEVVAEAGAADGIAFDFERIATAANTVDAHRLVLFGEQEGRLFETAEALFRAYFAEGKNLNDRADLLGAAEAAGLDRAAAEAWLDSDAGREAVAAGQADAQRLGISGVPFTVFENRYGLSGAQPVEAFAHALASAESV